MEERENTIEDLLIYNNNKLVADKIIQTLLNIRNVPGISAKRWIWELIQNAKDAYNPRFGSVEIKIHLKKKSLVFSHNGAFFTINNILGILQQISSKNSRNIRGQTGKFGTGFIGTHLLSNYVIIKGVIYYQQIYKRFKIELDRSSNSSEILAEEVSKSINDFRNNMNEGIKSKYETIGEVYNQRPTDFDTSFEYIFRTEEEKEIALKGLSDLINTAPVTLSNQSDKISKITILNDIDNEIKEFSVESEADESNSNNRNLYIVTIKTNGENEEKKIFFSCENNDCRLFFQVNQTENGFNVVERQKNQPILLRDFPLIGSENFYFPFFLNGFKFYPLETRSGLYLNGNYEEAKENRKIIERAINLSITFIKELIKENIDKKYLLAYSNIPEPPQKYDKNTIKWFIEKQKYWRKELLELPLVINEKNKSFSLKELKLPKFAREIRKKSNSSKNKYNIEFFRLFKVMNITGGKLPREKDAEKWFEIMENDPLKELYGIEENTWGSNYYLFTEEDCFQYINEKKNILNFIPSQAKNIILAYDWLKTLYKFLIKNNCIDCFNEYSIIPNRNDNFKKIDEIYGNDKKSEVPEVIYPIYKKIFNKEIKEIYLNENIDSSIFGDRIKKKSFEDILTEFSNFLKEDNDYELKIELCNELISYSIKNDRINKMYDFNIETDQAYKKKYEIKKKLNNYYKRHTIWRDVEDFWFEYHSSKIEEIKNINNLKEILTSDVYKNDPYDWLNQYIKFLKDNSTNIEVKKIFPNQLGEFKTIKYLRNDDDLPELLKEIYNNLKSKKDNRYEIKNILLNSKIISYSEYNKFTQKELIGLIENLFIESQDEKLKLFIAEKLIISLVPKNDTKKLKTINEALKKFIKYYNNISNRHLKTTETQIKTEINYGIFVKFLLMKLFENIENWQGLNQPIKIKENIKKIEKEINDLKIYKIDTTKLNEELEKLRSENASKKLIKDKEGQIESALINKSSIEKKETQLISLNESYNRIKEEVDKKIEMIAYLIKFAWDYQFNDYLYLAIDPKKYKIFVNQKYELQNISNVYIKEDFGNFKYTEVEQELFDLSVKKPISIDYEKMFLSKNYDIVLNEYRNNFKSLKLSDIYQKIDYNLTSFYDDYKTKNLNAKDFKGFGDVFFALHNILKKNKELRGNFPKFMRERGAIALRILNDEDDLDDLIDEVRGAVLCKTVDDEN